MYTIASNPLLQAAVRPPFSVIQPEHMVAAIKTITAENLTALQEQLATLQEPSWPLLLAPIEERDDRLNRAWAPISHLNGVANSESLRTAYNECISLLTQYNTEMGQNKDLYDAYVALSAQDSFTQLSAAQQKTVTNALRDFKLAGVNLSTEKKQRYGEIKANLSQLTNAYSNHVLDATQGWFKHIEQVQQLAGLPESAIAAAKQAAQTRNLEGWVLTLDGPVYMTVMTQADDQDLRQEIYTAFVTRASDQGPTAGQWDNTHLIEQILALRMELAALLGFGNYAELSLASKMAESTAQVVTFLRELAARAKPAAEVELKQLQTWVQETYGVASLNVWDVPYYSEKLKEAQFHISQEKLRPYFVLPKVLKGLFELSSELFNIQITKVEGEDVWHPDAHFYEIARDGKAIAHFYLDLFARAGKRGGAWMAECRVRRQVNPGMQLPVAFLVCNFNAPVEAAPCLLTHNEVTTLFHEFGHGLHHMLTQVDVAAVSGINGVAWDAVELPSQFMENWCWQSTVLKNLSGHFDTGEALSDELISKLQAAKNFQAAMMTLRQIEFALFDLRVHMEYGESSFAGVQAVFDQVREEVAVFTPPAFNRFQNSFSHIFAGGYAAGYYSYKWAELLSADAFAAFEENGLFDSSTGQRFLTEILEKGGSADAMALFKNFRGREPTIDALLRHSGISDEH